jgi:integrase
MGNLRHQRGYVYEASNRFYIRYRENGQQKSELLHAKDHKHHSPTCKAIRLLADEVMLKVNNGTAEHPESQDIITFYEQTHLPFIEKNLRASTVRGYKKIWAQHLKNHFTGRAIADYRTSNQSKLLTSLADSLNPRSLNHVRSMASGLFQHALNLGLINANPIRGSKPLGKNKNKPKPTEIYSLSEAQEILDALAEQPICQVIVAFGFFMGLRPSEIAGLRWEDVKDAEEWKSVSSAEIHIQRAVVNGIVGETKTEESAAKLPLIEPLFSLLKRWHRISGEPKSGWIFTNRKNAPHDMNVFQRVWITPILEKEGIRWKGLYACRRGAGTILTELTGDALAAQIVLRHKDIAVTTAYYVKPSVEAGKKGLKLLEAKVVQTVLNG